jgi:hypothetical protein
MQETIFWMGEIPQEGFEFVFMDGGSNVIEFS